MQPQRLLIAAAALAAAGAPAVFGETHHFAAKQYYNTFSFAHPPALKIKPGDRVITRTIDARGDDFQGKRVGERPNPQIGPFYVEGAEPGDMLVVNLEKIEPNRATAWTDSLLAPYTADPAFLRFTGGREQKTVTWNIDRQRRVAWVEAPGMRPSRVEVPLRPMLGCVGTAPPNKEAIHTSTPGTFGGNMDYNGMNAGVKVMLPVSEPGALLFLGDGHAVQGDGEVVGNATEISMDVEFSVNLVKKKSIGWPRLENDAHLVVLGSATSLLRSLQHATTELQKWLMEDYGFDERGAALLMGHALRYEIANVVDPRFTVAAMIPKALLKGGGR
jgi:acetamidase/formamidase